MRYVIVMALLITAGAKGDTVMGAGMPICALLSSVIIAVVIPCIT